MIFYTWNVVSIFSLMNGITKVNKENHSNALSLLVYIPDTRVLIYYQYLMIMIHGGMVTGKNGVTYS